MKKIILASKSIDRGELIRRTNVPFDILITNVNEEPFKKYFPDPIDLAKALAKAKAEKAKKKLLSEGKKNSIIIAADTIVDFKGEIIGKPKDDIEAFEILDKLVGNTHKLITGIAITETNSEKMVSDFDITEVKFLELNYQEIKGYIKTEEWKGRAGAYSIRDKASLFIESIKGSSSNVIGLPMHKVFQILKKEFFLNLLK